MSTGPWAASPRARRPARPINWNFTWDLDNPDGRHPLPRLHVCRSRRTRYDAQGPRRRAALPSQWSLNRRAPVAPDGFGGGRNGCGDYVDLQWVPNPECDIAGYRVYRSSDTPGPRVPDHLPRTRTIRRDPKDMKCLDEPAAGGRCYYTVDGLDLLAGGGAPARATPAPQILSAPPTAGAAGADERRALHRRRHRRLRRRRRRRRRRRAGGGELGSVHRPGRHRVLPDLPRRDLLRQPL